MRYRIDRRSGVTAYMQIVQQTKQAMRLGVLVPGSRLPTAREVVATTAINPNTVHKAYRELEHEGLVESRRGAGTFVVRSLSRPETASSSSLSGGLREWLQDAHAAGLDRDDVTALFTALIEEYGASPQAPTPEQEASPSARDIPASGETNDMQHTSTEDAG
ncbi:GntR family transcriptional regulator [Streptomyces aurantiogriseus]|uniref:GntR family transcriptional regulator n=2 Tax=Streptomyces aurantiogriseus TaxID=66870 RepID=A0A918F6K4_9ACTN|nr:GntR family transcriptional regulator [Streptomyces aurantiogriseus]